MNNLSAWASMRMRTRRRTYPSPSHSSILQHRNRSEAETAASRGPARTVCKYDIVTDAIATDDDSTTNLITGVVQVADMWTTKRGGDYAAWLDAAPANNEEAP